MKRLTVILLAVVLGFALLSSPSISEARGGHGGGGGGGGGDEGGNNGANPNDNNNAHRHNGRLIGHPPAVFMGE